VTHRIDLPNGGWADICEATELSNRNRKLVRRYSLPAFKIRDRFADAPADPANITPEESAAALDHIDPDDLDVVDAMQAAFIVAFTVAWSLDQPLPTLETVDDLPGPIFDILAAATAGQGDGTPDFGPDGAIDPASPTVPSPA
jgi:hypothetical protein